MAGITIGGFDWSPYARLAALQGNGGGDSGGDDTYSGMTGLYDPTPPGVVAMQNARNVGRHQDEFMRQAIGLNNPDMDTGTYLGIQRYQQGQDDRNRSIYHQGLQQMRQAKLDAQNQEDRAKAFEMRQAEHEDRQQQTKERQNQLKRNALASKFAREAQQAMAAAAEEGVDPTVAARLRAIAQANLDHADDLHAGVDVAGGQQAQGVIGQAQDQANQYRGQNRAAQLGMAQAQNARTPEQAMGAAQMMDPRGQAVENAGALQGMFGPAMRELAPGTRNPVRDEQLAMIKNAAQGRADQLMNIQDEKDQKNEVMQTIRDENTFTKTVKNIHGSNVTADDAEKLVADMDVKNPELKARLMAEVRGKRIKENTEIADKDIKRIATSKEPPTIQATESLRARLKTIGLPEDEIEDKLKQISPTYETFAANRDQAEEIIQTKGPSGAMEFINNELDALEKGVVDVTKKDGTVDIDKNTGKPKKMPAAAMLKHQRINVAEIRKQLLGMRDELQQYIDARANPDDMPTNKYYGLRQKAIAPDPVNINKGTNYNPQAFFSP